MNCKFCNVKLESHYYHDMNTPIGLNADDMIIMEPDYLYCPKCGLVYQKINGENNE